MKRLIFCIVCIIATAAGIRAQSTSEITAAELKAHLKYLASEELAGRRTGDEGNRKAAVYLEKEYKSYGLEPAGDNGTYFQEFEFVDAIKAGKNNSFSATIGGTTRTFVLDKEYTPLGFSSDTSVTTSVVFAGYGITADSLKYDDYAGIDAKGKFVAVMRSAPDQGMPGGSFAKLGSLQSKTMNARKHGAVGIIILNSPADSAGDKFYALSYDRGFSNSGLASVSMTNPAFNELIKAKGKDLGSIQQTINTAKQPFSFEIPGVKVTIATELEKIRKKSSNVCAFLPGSDPALKDEIIVIGAHFDHLGWGGQGSMKPDTVAIHFGADDNGSGTVGLLEAAQYFSSIRKQLRRSILFLSFTGEELGLLGSDWYANHPTKPIDKMITMINMDMIGRLKDSILVIEGMGSSPNWEPLLKKYNADGRFKLQFKQDAYGPSDHTSFSIKKIPVIFFFTNLHEDYHKPSDTWDKINYEGEAQVVRYMTSVATEIDTMTTKPVYTQAAMPSSTYGGGGDYKVTLGVIPDMASDVVGMKISGVRPGGAAEEAGLKADDIITKFGDSDVKNLYDYTALLGKYKPGDVVTIVVKRRTEEVTLKAKFKAKK